MKTRLNYLIDIKDYLDGCVTCGLPRLLHKVTTCTRCSQADVQKECKIWTKFRERIMPIVLWMKSERDKEKDT